jgi:hypothetical protein
MTPELVPVAGIAAVWLILSIGHLRQRAKAHRKAVAERDKLPLIRQRVRLPERPL